MSKVVPLKQFGQNYLTDKNIINKIIETINPAKDENFLEIGPGQGALTEKILERCGTLTAIEIDTRVIEDLSARFGELKLINHDFLKFDFNSDNLDLSKKIRVAGNIPYNITSPILFKLIEQKDKIQDCHLMMQLEVAKRITAVQNTKDYGILAVILNYIADTKLCFKISPNVFYPKPKVFSAIIKIDFKDKLPDQIKLETFIKVVKAAFGNRRKTLKNSLSNSIFSTCDFADLDIDLTKRAENLTIENYITLTKYVQERFYDKN
ncbi:MAG: 16S rRNA (adenine(1518)-N(6)/adenine(1519)-N(6))-dimethyltransferase RsmA [Rhodothermaceae bacterium]